LSVVRFCGFECQDDAANDVTGGHLSLNGVGASIASSAGFSHSGSYFGLINHLTPGPGPASSYFQAPNFVTSSGVLVWSVYVYFDALPNINTLITYRAFPGPGYYRGIVYNAADHKLYTGGTATIGGATGITVTTGQWYLVECRITSTVSPWVIEGRVDGVALGTWTVATTAVPGAFGSVGFGNRADAAASFQVRFDDWQVSTTSGDYPLGGANSIKLLRPNADGTHDVAANQFFFGTGTGSPISGATTTVNASVDEIPATTSDFISLQTAADPNGYVEVAFENMATDDIPSKVELIGWTHEAGTGNCTHALRLIDGDGLTLVGKAHTGAGSPSLRSSVTGLVLTTSRAYVDGLVARWGFTDDPTPNSYLDALALEVMYVVPATFDAGVASATAGANTASFGADAELAAGVASATASAPDASFTAEATFTAELASAQASAPEAQYFTDVEATDGTLFADTAHANASAPEPTYVAEGNFIAAVTAHAWAYAPHATFDPPPLPEKNRWPITRERVYGTRVRSVSAAVSRNLSASRNEVE
jgi:hypothetical protein